MSEEPWSQLSPNIRRRELTVIIRDQYGTDLPAVGDTVPVDLGFGQLTEGRVIGVYNMDVVRVRLPDGPLP